MGFYFNFSKSYFCTFVSDLCFLLPNRSIISLTLHQDLIFNIVSDMLLILYHIIIEDRNGLYTILFLPLVQKMYQASKASKKHYGHE